MANNLNSILQLDDDFIYDKHDEDDELSFKLSHYHDDQTISSFCSHNRNGLNFMSLNAQSIFQNVEMLRQKLFSFLTSISLLSM